MTATTASTRLPPSAPSEIATGVRSAPFGLLDRVLLVTLCVTVALLPLEGAVLVGGSATITIYVGALSTAAFFGSLVFERRPIHRSGAPGHALFLRIALSALGLVFWTQDPESTQRQFQLLLRLSLLSIIVFQVAAGSERRRRLLCQSFGVGAATAAFIIVNNWRLDKTWVEASGNVQRTIAEAGVGAAQRFSVGRVDPNYMALVLGVGLCMVWASFPKRPSYALTPLLAFGIVLTGSRTALVAAFIGGLYFFTRGAFAGRQRARLFAGMLVGTAAVAFSWQFVPVDTQVRAQSVLTAKEDASANERRDAWAGGISAFAQRPVLGAGLASFLVYTSNVTDLDPSAAHSLYVNQLVEGGLVGTLISIYGFLGVWRATANIRASTRVSPERLALIVWAATGIALDLDLNKLTFVLLPLCLSLGVHTRTGQTAARDELPAAK